VGGEGETAAFPKEGRKVKPSKGGLAGTLKARQIDAFPTKKAKSTLRGVK